jgi:carbon-monoxide dehydrogenase medium subunit
MADCRYTRAQSVDEAVACLTEARGDGHIIAGGVALGILMNEKLVDPTWLIDISALDEVRGIELLGDGTLRIGALVTHREIERSDIVARAVPMLPEMAAEIACGRIKNRGTIGGNICLADPQGDPPAAILALRATLRAVGPNGTRDIAATDFFTDVYTTALGDDEMLQDIRLPPLPANCGTAFGKYAARRAMDYTSTISAAVALVVDPDDGRIADIGVGLGGVGYIPVWPRATEAVLAGGRPDQDTFAQMAETLFNEVEPIEDDLYSADYKRHVAAVILKRTVARAYERAAADTGGSGQ